MALAGAMAESEEFDVVAAVPPVPHVDRNMAAAHARPWESLSRLLPLLELAPVRSFTVTTEAPKERATYRLYDDCKRVAAYHRKHGHPPRLRFPADICKWADERLAGGVVVNLRANSAFHAHRNANRATWDEALALAGVPFVEVPSGHGLLCDMALIHRARAFVGSPSGPASIATLGSAPYFVVAADMEPHLARYGGSLRKVGTDLVFSWASPNQRWSTLPESVPVLVEAIRALVS